MAQKKARPRKRSHLKRRVSTEFIQIAAAGSDRLFALDAAGGVWQHDALASVWKQLAVGRISDVILDDEDC